MMFKKISVLCALVFTALSVAQPVTRPAVFNLPKKLPLRCQVVTDTASSSKKAYLVQSYKNAQGKLIKGGVGSTIIPLTKSDNLVIDYDFKPRSDTSRYALLIVGANGSSRVLTLVIAGKKFQVLGSDHKVIDAGPVKFNSYQHIRYVLHPQAQTFDIYIDNMKEPVVVNAKFRDKKFLDQIRLNTLGNPYVPSQSYFANVTYSVYPPKSFPILAPRPIVRPVEFRKPFRNFEQFVPVKSELPRSYCLSSYRNSSGKFIKGSAYSEFIQFNGADQVSIDYEFKATSPQSRYALLVMGNKSRSRCITMVVTGKKFQIIGANGKTYNIGEVKFNQWQHIRYVIRPLTAHFDVYIDDMSKPALANQEFRDGQTVSGIQLFSLGHPNNPSKTYFANLKSTLYPPKSFPSATLGYSPFFIGAAGVISDQPTEENWKNAPIYDLTSTAKLANRAQCRLLQNSKQLFLRFEFAAKKFHSPISVVRDGKVWQDDCLEIFIAPHPKQDEYFHLVGNANGDQYDARCRVNPCVRNVAWNCKWLLNTQKNSNGWIADVTLYWDEFGGKPQGNNYWLVNLCRENPGEKELFSWSATRDFHNPKSWGKLFTGMNDCTSGDYAVFSKHYFNNSSKANSVERQLQEIKQNFSDAERGNLVAKSEDKLLKSKKKFASVNNFFSQYSYHKTLSEVEFELKQIKQQLIQLRSNFAPGSEAEKAGFIAHAHSFMTKLSPDNFTGGGEKSLQLTLAGGEYGGGQFSLFFKSPLPQGTPITLETENFPRSLKVQTFQMLPVVSSAPNRLPNIHLDIMQPGKKFSASSRNLLVFAVDFRIPRGMPKKNFSGRFIIKFGKQQVSLPVLIHTTGFDLPLKRSLDTAFCFHDKWVTDFYKQSMTSAQKRNFLRFVAAHHLEPMDLWGKEPDIGLNMLDFAHAELGKQLLFLHIDRIADSRKLIEKYRGKLHPILFGYDEVLDYSEKVARMQRAFQKAKLELPGIDRLNTARIDERLFNYVNLWCPRFHEFNVANAKHRQKLGEKVWWYATNFPLQPYPNFNLDSPGVDCRIIPWMNWKIGVTGLLYWALNREWLTNANDGQYITEEEIRQRGLTWLTPKVRRDMVSGKRRFPDIPWLSYFRHMSSLASSKEAGAGNLIYPGPHFTPWASLRLKNLRDGLQDYEYFILLKHNVQELKQKNKAPALVWEAEKQLAIDNKLVASLTSYTKDPAKILTAKTAIAELINQTKKALK